MRALVPRRLSFGSTGAPFLLVLLTAVPAGTQELVGDEFQANTFTTATQERPSIARQEDGGFLIVWQSSGQDGDGVGISGQIYDASGTAVGGEFLVNTYTTSLQRYPSAAAADNGEFLVVWQSLGQDGSSSGVFGQRLSPSGALLGPEFRVNTYTTGEQWAPRVAASRGGRFVVVWDSRGQDGSFNGVFGQCFSNGMASGAEFQVNSVTTMYQYLPDVAMNADGAFVVVWVDDPRQHSYGQLYAPDCTRVGGEFLANDQLWPSVGMDSAGSFVVVGGGFRIHAQRFAPDGAPRGTTFQVNTYTTTTGVQVWPRVAVEPSGDFVASWETYDFAAFQVARISARAFRSSGSPAGLELAVNTYTTGLRSRSAVATDDDGNFVVSWTGSDGSGDGIKAQRYLVSDLIFADGFNAGDLGAWSSAVAGGGDLSVTPAAAMASTALGLQGVVNDTAGLYVQDDSPSDENRYHARFYFDPNGFDPGVAQGHLRTRIFIGFEEAPNRRLFAVVLKLQNAQYSLLGRVRRDDGSQADTGFFPITDAPHYVEVDWRRSSGPDALDGTFRLWIDGASVAMLTGLDNGISSVDFARMGALSVKTGATGTMFWDEFESRRRTDIGPVP